ncbi:pyrroline-5-carboxylate reductase family protein [Vibrio furnissii]|uniref:pyrroline-5-carboxylate reductase family protein n=1 Tax=Vibrio furnissii TaxID=29494 RepID=UPI001EEB0373|nr:NAD(P)-binding domain-containing protein [Vibrio furnissii]MCG6232345.1 NAD(P)-binding domain-containing protein [Vibrio furnissii]MCG6259705.1 NAD(P)-binding domain-containing protein [Vibrio furnissii]
MAETIGILGVGHLACYVVAALRRAGDTRRIVLSPRNQERAKYLQSSYGCDIAVSNQAVVDECNVVLLAVRPDQLKILAAEIAPTSDHLLISCIAGISLKRLQARLPQPTIVRTQPLASVEVGEGVVPLFPQNATAQSILNPIGKFMVFDSEADYDLAGVAAVMNGVVFGFMAELSEWFQSKGMTDEQSRTLVTHTLRGATGLADYKLVQSLSDINHSIATPGTFTLTAQEMIKAEGGFEAWLKACEEIQRQISE